MGPTPLSQRLSNAARAAANRYRISLSRPDAVLQLALLGVVSGLLAGAVIVVFRLLVEWAQVGWMPGGQAQKHESLPGHWRLLLPTAGGALIGMLFWIVPAGTRRVGVLHIMERLAYYQGNLPWRNALMQFFGGAIALVMGHSVGREGPSAHLGAASTNVPGQAVGLPNNSLRVLAACGAAAGIAASFNTPLAGVAFSMEVLVIEYSVAGFAPVILAAVSATMLSRMVYGDAVAFTVPPVSLGSLYELPLILVGGVAIGALAALFSMALEWTSRHGRRIPVLPRLTLAGLIVGLCGLAVPQVLGIGNDTVTSTLLGQLGLGVLAAVLVFKLLATTLGIGLGIPGGVIGPSLVVGAAAGGLLGALGQQAGALGDSAPGLYALLGMGAMMAGILQAPLTGLIAILELTGSPAIILPGMLAVIAGTVTAWQLYGKASVFQGLMRSLGLDYRNDPVTQSLRRVGVAGVMDRNVSALPRMVDRRRIESELGKDVRWILIRTSDRPEVLLAAIDLVRAAKEAPEATEFDLFEVPGSRLQTAAIDLRANLQEAKQQMESQGAEALYVTTRSTPGLERVYGVLTRQDIENAYRS